MKVMNIFSGKDKKKNWIYQKDVTVLYVYTANHKFTSNIHQETISWAIKQTLKLLK